MILYRNQYLQSQYLISVPANSRNRNRIEIFPAEKKIHKKFSRDPVEPTHHFPSSRPPSSPAVTSPRAPTKTVHFRTPAGPVTGPTGYQTRRRRRTRSVLRLSPTRPDHQTRHGSGYPSQSDWSSDQEEEENATRSSTGTLNSAPENPPFFPLPPTDGHPPNRSPSPTWPYLVVEERLHGRKNENGGKNRRFRKTGGCIFP
jgi:hypothetical protein